MVQKKGNVGSRRIPQTQVDYFRVRRQSGTDAKLTRRTTSRASKLPEPPTGFAEPAASVIGINMGMIKEACLNTN